MDKIALITALSLFMGQAVFSQDYYIDKDCYSESIKTGFNFTINYPVFVKCGDNLKHHFGNDNYCYTISGLPNGKWFVDTIDLNLNIFDIRINCITEPFYYDILSEINGPNGNSEAYTEVYNVIILPLDTVFITEFTQDSTKSGVYVEKYNVPPCDCDSIVVRGILYNAVTSEPEPESNGKILFPNAFSPNYDGINDVFIPLGDPLYAHIEYMRIYDRWGEQLFESYDFDPSDFSAGWDGSFRGQNCFQGVYVWVAEVRYSSGQTKLFMGDVSLLR